MPPRPCRRLRVCLSLSTALAAATAVSATDFWVYFGTYTGGDSTSAGIYRSTFDATTGTLSPPVLAAPAANPTFLALSPDFSHLYAVGPGSDPTLGNDAVSAYTLAVTTGELTFLNAVSTRGAGPCHVNLDRTGRMVTFANYGGGSCGSCPLGPDGALLPAASFWPHEGHGAIPARQAGPHAHSVNFSPDNRFAYVCDLGLDQVRIYRADPASGTLAAHEPAFAALPPGSGPRHLAFHPDGRHVFVNNELGVTVTTCTYDAATGGLTPIETVSTLPSDITDHTGLSTAETVVHPNGRFVYVSNRGHDTIAVFGFDAASGHLTRLANVPCEGRKPRNFALDPTGRWLIVAHQDSHSLALFAVDPATGGLRFTGTRYDLGAPVCVRFVPRAPAEAR